MAGGGTEILNIGTAVWAEWDTNCYYRGKVIDIKSSSTFKVKFDDDDELTFNISERDHYKVVLDKELSKDETKNLKESEPVLVKLRYGCKGKTMHRGVIINVEHTHGGVVTIAVENIVPDIAKVRKRPTSIRIFREYTVASPNDITENNKVAVEQQLDSSVEILSVRPKKLIDPAKLDLLNSPKNGNDLRTPQKPKKPIDSATLDIFNSTKRGKDLPIPLSPEVMWGKQNLIDFESSMESKNTVCNDPFEETIGLSMDPLLALNPASAADARSPQHHSTPIQYSTACAKNVISESNDLSESSLLLTTL